jgi:hypothetical protein
LSLSISSPHISSSFDEHRRVEHTKYETKAEKDKHHS